MFAEKDDLASVFNYDEFGLVVYVGADRMISGTKKAIQNYMNGGGRVLFLGGPVFEEELFLLDGEYATYEEFRAAAWPDTECEEQALVLNTRRQSTLSQLTRVVLERSLKATTSIVSVEHEEVSGALCVDLQNAYGWDTLRTQVNVYVDYADSICFWAKAGNADTTDVGLSFSSSGCG